MIVGLTGAAGSGKDTVADILVSHRGFLRIAFADALYEEVSAAFGVSVGFLKNRDTKETATPHLALDRCADEQFVSAILRVAGEETREASRSPRQILQWWGTEYRRAKQPDYWLNQVRDRIRSDPEAHWVIPDVRFQNEADILRSLGGHIGLVLRAGVAPVVQHVSEAFWRSCEPDFTLHNDGTLDDLREAVLSMG